MKTNLFKLTLIINLVFLLMTEIGNTKIDNNEYNYFDGSANRYIIDPNYIEYKPIQPINSSTGLYSGGKYTKKKLNATDFNEIVLLINQAITNKSIHIKDRIKGSGMIIIKNSDSSTSTYIISNNSKEKINLEKKLKKLILEN